MTAYLWLKAAHIIFVITWFAGLFYLPRLFIYHTQTRDPDGIARFKLMQHKLYTVIMRPSMVLAVGFGIGLLVHAWAQFGTALWLWTKVVLVLALLGYHHYCLYIMRALARDEQPHSERFLRIFNEIPALALIGIVILVVVKPF